MHRHEMQQSNIYLGIYIKEYYFFSKNQGVTSSLQFDTNLILGSFHFASVPR
jgi:hypothetical protein